MFQTKLSKEAESEEWFVDSMRNDKTKKILKSIEIKPLYKGKPQGRGCSDYSSEVARFT